MGRTPTGRREQIVEAARIRFAANGYEGTAIGDLARDLDISKAAIAYYFPTKDDFLVEFITPLLDDLDRATAEATDARGALVAYLDVVVANREVAVWLDTDTAILNNPTYRRRLDEINGRVVRLITGGSRRRADRIRALGVLGGLWRPVRESRATDLVEHQEEIIDSALASY